MDYGAALEMRFGATRRGFESRPLRHRVPREHPMGALSLALLTHAAWAALAPVLSSAFPSGARAGRDDLHGVPAAT